MPTPDTLLHKEDAGLQGSWGDTHLPSALGLPRESAVSRCSGSPSDYLGMGTTYVGFWGQPLIQNKSIWQTATKWLSDQLLSDSAEVCSDVCLGTHQWGRVPMS